MDVYQCDRCGACCQGHLIVEADDLDVLREPRLIDVDPHHAGQSVERVVDGIRKFATVTFKGSGGSYKYSGGVGVSLPLSGVEQKRGELRFVLQTGGRSRHYIGKWDGTRLSGKISGEATGSGELGTFELTPR